MTAIGMPALARIALLAGLAGMLHSQGNWLFSTSIEVADFVPANRDY
jgi:hypothetical protein